MILCFPNYQIEHQVREKQIKFRESSFFDFSNNNFNGCWDMIPVDLSLLVSCSCLWPYRRKFCHQRLVGIYLSLHFYPILFTLSIDAHTCANDESWLTSLLSDSRRNDFFAICRYLLFLIFRNIETKFN